MVLYLQDLPLRRLAPATSVSWVTGALHAWRVTLRPESGTDRAGRAQRVFTCGEVVRRVAALRLTLVVAAEKGGEVLVACDGLEFHRSHTTTGEDGAPCESVIFNFRIPPAQKHLPRFSSENWSDVRDVRLSDGDRLVWSGRNALLGRRYRASASSQRPR